MWMKMKPSVCPVLCIIHAKKPTSVISKRCKNSQHNIKTCPHGCASHLSFPCWMSPGRNQILTHHRNVKWKLELGRYPWNLVIQKSKLLSVLPPGIRMPGKILRAEIFIHSPCECSSTSKVSGLSIFALIHDSTNWILKLFLLEH
jgi:hypothetical protein